ncbi:MAG: 2-C-methyl-D-erythritol 2,4-cyclodiphosphate synthase [Synergistaceae bacterium]|jgi:2-C-methyl-D-erythritol 4-phosphate cytidylyltransferase/2-C-methyl-D-erythritol 2,4-cyclodiphosphate synthase|nr:2-C-methyl-D-erythritol 2,4-cyclodiphosphate synthase [Synergistaceae bacterium]
MSETIETYKSFSFLIVAGGRGSRIGGQGKQFRPLGEEEKPLWRWSVDLAFSAASEAGTGLNEVKEVVLVLPQGHETREIANIQGSLPLKVTFGGPVRTDSVRNGLKAASCDYVLVHDAARPFASLGLLRALMERTTPTVGAIPVMPITEAIKRLDGAGKVLTLDREGLYATQTPQSFFRETLLRVLEKENVFSKVSKIFKDEAEAWLAAGFDLSCVEGERLNFKVTWPEDLELAEALVASRWKIRQNRGKEEEEEEEMVRTGIGYDVHRLTPGRPLILGGVEVPFSLGLLGHSDADVLAHAVADALLGAAGLPDIGNLFPASDESYRDANSLELLQRVVELVQKERWEIVWVDAVIEAQVPRLNAHLPAMREKLSAILSWRSDKRDSDGDFCPNSKVNLKVKSAEKTGDPGLGRSMICRAVATLRRAQY